MDRYVGEQGRIIVIRKAGSAVACLCAVDVKTGCYYFSSSQSSLHMEHKHVYLFMQNGEVFCLRHHTQCTEVTECGVSKHIV